MIVEYVRYRVAEERRSAFEAAYSEAQASLIAAPECRGFELTRAFDEPERYVLRIEWTSREGHLEGFRKSAVFKTFLGHVRPFIEDLEEMQHYERLAVRSPVTIYEDVGGAETFFAIARAMHEKNVHDPLLGPRFKRAAPTHVPHLGMWLCEVFGGPKLYSVTLGDIGPILDRHKNQDIEEEARARFAELAIEAAQEVIGEGHERALGAIAEYMEWGTSVAVENSKPDHVADPSAGVPVWDWPEEG